MVSIEKDLELQHFSKEGFIRLLQYVLEHVAPRNICFAQNDPVCHKRIEIHPDYFFDIPLLGRKHITYGNGHDFVETVLLPGDILFSRPFAWKQPFWDLPHEMTCFIYRENFIRITYVNIQGPLLPEIYPQSSCFFHTQLPPSEAIKKLLTVLALLSERGDPGNAAPEIAHGIFKLTLEMLKEDHTQLFSKAETTFHRLQQYLHDNFHSNINRKYTAYVFNLHPGYVSRLYKENGQKSFSETLYSLRMEHASMLLRNTEQNISTIASSCGYESLPSFNVAFKKYNGLPPGKFRQLYQGKTIVH